MKQTTIKLGLLLLLGATGLSAEAASITSGNYRIPYATGTDVVVLQDHQTHSPPDQIDIMGVNNNPGSPYRIVAAADGVVRAIVDSNTGGCVNCPTSNNYVWIQHPNGEWTGYFFLQNNSVIGVAGLAVGSNVVAGQTIGIEGNIGKGGSAQLHFEVGVPDNPASPINVSTGALVGENRIPIICNIAGNILKTGIQYTAASCEAQVFSYGVYRLPYTNNTEVKFNNDHLTHAPVKTRLDLAGRGGTPQPYAVVAAAAGTIMAIVDTNTITCTTNNCSQWNNYVWIRHGNGEWTKYTHFATGTVLGKAGRKVGDVVAAGAYLGDEGQVGAASGLHLHFEVGVPTNNVTPFQASGGFLNGNNRIPLFCDIPGNIGYDDQTFVASPCASPGDCAPDITLTSHTIRSTEAYLAGNTVDSGVNGLLIDTYGSLALRAGKKITLRPGFQAKFNSYLRASIQNCNTAP